jgi:hypothetical protein
MVLFFGVVAENRFRRETERKFLGQGKKAKMTEGVV